MVGLFCVAVGFSWVKSRLGQRIVNVRKKIKVGGYNGFGMVSYFGHVKLGLVATFDNCSFDLWCYFIKPSF